mmetsp:Transcript_66110/g.208937  ORF Transcript_66110/g.208937 Transcript_66110/m.208937 type:complete len:149 (+) Transcript_66110:43-489(+)
MNACFKSAEADMALEVLESLREAGIPLDQYAFESGIYACNVGRQWLQALEMLQDARQARVHLGARARSAGVSACVKSGKWQEAQVLMKQAAEEGCPLVSGLALNSMVLAYKRAQHWGEAVGLLEDMARPSNGRPRDKPADYRFQPGWM